MSPPPPPQTYVQDFRFQSITSEQFFAHFLNHFPHLQEAGAADRCVLRLC